MFSVFIAIFKKLGDLCLGSLLDPCCFFWVMLLNVFANQAAHHPSGVVTLDHQKREPKGEKVWELGGPLYIPGTPKANHL